MVVWGSWWQRFWATSGMRGLGSEEGWGWVPGEEGERTAGRVWDSGFGFYCQVGKAGGQGRPLKSPVTGLLQGRVFR